MLLLAACTEPSGLAADEGVGVPAPERIPGTRPEEGAEGLPGGATETTTEPDDEAAAVFDLSAVHEVTLTMAPNDWIQVRDNPSTEIWYPAAFTWDGEALPNIGIRAFGQGSVVAGKPPLKLGFDHFVPGTDWRGLEQLKLDSSIQDAGFLNEVVGTRVLREMGLPAARTGWANVTVNGEPAGLFVALEPIDDRFLSHTFGDDEGPLYGMATWMYGQGLNPITWGTVADWYLPETSTGGDGSEIVAAMAALANGTDEEVEAAVDMEAFTRIAVTRAAIGAIDAFAADGNNFYLYVEDGRITPIAWDLDADLGYPGYFDNALQMGLEEPWLWSHARYNPVTGAVYADPVHSRAVASGWDVAGWRDSLLEGPLDWPTIEAQIDGYTRAIRDSACADTYHTCASFEHRVMDLKFFLHSRLSTLAEQEVADCADPPGWPVTVEAGSVTENATVWGPGFMIAGVHACTGLYAPAPSRLVLDVSAGTFSGAVGVHDENQNTSSGVRFSIVQDGATLWDSGAVAAYATAVPYAVSVAAGTVTLVAAGDGGASWVGLGAP